MVLFRSPLRSRSRLRPQPYKSPSGLGRLSSIEHKACNVNSNGSKFCKVTESPPSKKAAHSHASEVPFQETEVQVEITHGEVKRIVVELGELFWAFLQTNVGGARKKKEANQFRRTFVNFLRFVIKQKSNQDDGWNPLLLCRTIRHIIKKEFTIFGDFLQRFELSLKAGTILNYWNHLLQCARWFHFYCILNSRRCRGSLTNFEYYMKSLRKVWSKATKRARIQATHERIERDRQTTPLTLKDLRDTVVMCLPRIRALTKEHFLIPQVYSGFTDWLFACLYCTSPQGRQGGIQDMKYKQRHDLLVASGYATSSNFKTAYNHTLQAVSSSAITAEGIAIYVDRARPAVASEEMYEDNAPLFLAQSGVGEYRAGDKVARYFKLKIGRQVTTTDIRRMFDTETDTLCTNGYLSPKHKAAMNKIAGHSEQISNQYYVQQRVHQSLSTAREAFKVILGGSSNNSSMNTSSSPNTVPETKSDSWTNVCDTHWSSSDNNVDSSPTESFNLNAEDQDLERLSGNSDSIGQDLLGHAFDDATSDDDSRNSSILRSNAAKRPCFASNSSSHPNLGGCSSSSTPRDNASNMHDHSNRLKSNDRTMLDSPERDANNFFESESNWSSLPAVSTVSESTTSSSLNPRYKEIFSAFIRQENNGTVMNSRHVDIDRTSNSPSKTSLRSDSPSLYGDDSNNDHLMPLPLYPRQGTARLPKRISWTDDEKACAQIMYDKTWVQLPPESRRSMAKHMLAEIRKDPYALSIFHPKHIESPEKFRHVLRMHVKRRPEDADDAAY